ncbi:MAG: mechanosensitive ion channel [Phycisphaerales bacterium]
MAIARYFIVIVGMAATFAFLHIGWANVQWLAAAVTVGLGFGLQEIFANFVSGLIMLAERPVSVGDVVTVDTVTGRVKKIATRATTIVDGDNRDVIIPNKQFITGRIVNWTLGGNAVRFVLPVGVAYGSDLQQAQRILREAVTGVTGVLASPAPEVLLRTLGPSAIEFEIWFYCDRPADGTVARHELVQRVVSMLGAEGIAIPFPQMEVRMVPAGAQPAGAAPAESRA